ncbi:F-box domain [Dillenia turbinata]|uniref:F-box domain n=1 Tax=Dillenia turbinata TaxID=194707 RepID=A0AAN8W7J7_9MAGN
MSSPDEVPTPTYYSPSAATIAGNQDLITPILIRLPTKSLVRFKSVSKQWRSLISSHHFSLFHFTQNHKCNGLFLLAPDYKIRYKLLSLQTHQDSSSNPSYFSLNLDNALLGIQILQSCCGLLLCSSTNVTFENPNYYVCNPVTKKYKCLPPQPNLWTPAAEEAIFWFVLAFDPFRSVNNYRVVCLRVHNYAMIEVVDSIWIYNSVMGNWRAVSDDPFQVPSTVMFSKGVYWNGTILWPNIKKVDVSSCDIQELLCYDIDPEIFRMIPMPPVEGKTNFAECEYFGESCGHLHLVYKHKSGEFDVFEMERDYSKWVLKFHFDSRNLNFMSENQPSPLLVLNLVSGMDEGESYLLLSESGRIICCKFWDGRVKEVSETPDGAIDNVLLEHYWCSSINYHQYMETLFLPG